MERTFAEKLLGAEHGSIVVRRPDFVMSHDNSARVRRVFEHMEGTDVCDPEQLVVVLDGKVAGITSELAAEYAAIRDFVKEQGVKHFYDRERGICHQLLAELVRPGMFVVGSDSHTSTAGAFNTFAFGVNKTETAVAWKTGRVWCRVPESIKVVLKGRLADGVTAKDLALWIMGLLRGMNVNGQFVEYHGEGVATLSMADRMTVANISSEMGVVGAVFPPDDVLADYYGQPAVRGVWADNEAVYARYVEVDLSSVFPVAYDAGRDRIFSVNELGALEVQQGVVGGCASGRMEDLRQVAMVLDGEHLASGFQLYVVPASREIYFEALEEGLIDKITRAGAIVLGSGCGPCVGISHVAAAGNSRMISTMNTRFAMDVPGDGIGRIVASPLTVAMTALRGRLSTMVNFEGARYPRRERMVEHSRLEEYDYRRSDGVWNYSDIDNISTEQLFAERLTYKIASHETDCIRPYLLGGLDEHFAREAQPGDIVVVGENFGCGRLTKHGVTGLVAVGVKLIIAKSVNREFFRMAMNHGLRIVIAWDVAKAYTSRDHLGVDWEKRVLRLNNQEYPLPSEDIEFTEMMEKGGLLKAFV